MDYRSVIKGVLFDFDGTLTRPGSLDFNAVKAAVGCPPTQPVLEYIDALADEGTRRRAMAQLEAFETRAAAKSIPNSGAEALIAHLKQKQVSIGILTRNSRRSVDMALEHFDTLGADSFDVIVSRDDDVAPKPAPDGVLAFARRTGNVPAEILVVGDYLFDIDAGRAAGAMTALVPADHDFHPDEADSDIVAASLDDLRVTIDRYLPLAGGKLPNAVLARLLNRFAIKDPSIIITAGVGEDTAAVDIAGEEVLILKSDPITFATDRIGDYAVLVNANDVATAGAKPRWFLTTLLFPIGVTTAYIETVMAELHRVSKKWGITLCGGHTEITDAVSRPVVTGMMAGTVAGNRLIDKRDMQPGDEILLTKGVSVEGTAIIAREFHHRLAEMGMHRQDIDDAADLLHQISILPEAEIAAGIPEVVGMHDVTEGGLATAALELSIAGGHRFQIDLDQVPILDATRAVCELMGLDPLGLIGSGSLLICCRPEGVPRLLDAVGQTGTAITSIGRVTAKGTGIEAHSGSRPRVWPQFDVDEITRLFQKH